MALNLGNAVDLQAHQNNVGIARQQLETNFLIPAVIPLGGMGYLCTYAGYISAPDIIQDQYVLLSTNVTTVPSFANLSQPGAFAFAVFKAALVTLGHIGFKRIPNIQNDASAATAPAQAEATYGPMNHMLFYPIPPVAEGADPPRFLVANTALEISLRGIDPAFAPAPAAPVIPPAGAPVPLAQDAVQQIILGQQAAVAAAKETPSKIADFARLQSMANVFSPGQYALILNLCMLNLQPGQPASAGFISFHRIVQQWRKKFHDFASYQLDRTVTASDSVLERIILLDFQNDKCSFLHLATPSDLPITFQNLKSFMGRMADLVAIIYGSDLGLAIITGIAQLVDMVDLSFVDHLKPANCISLMERALHQLDVHPLFNTAVFHNPDVLATSLATALCFENNHPEILRFTIANSRAATAALAAAIAQPSTTSTQQNARNTKRKATSTAGAAPAAKTGAVSTRAQTMAEQAAWRAKLDAANPRLVGVDLPCLHWLSGKAPCANQATCQKQQNKRDHVSSAVVLAHKAKILAWLKTDPLGRF